MKSLKIKDNQYKNKEEFFEIKSLINCVADKTLEQLEREGIFVFPEKISESEDLTKDQVILRSFNDKYITGNVMGFLGMGEERLIIESRFNKGEKDYFFQYLLEKVLEFPNFINWETSASQDNKIFNVLLFLFPRYLKEALRKGLFKTYVRKQYNGINVNGTIDVAAHIKKNTPFVGKIAYSQREYSCNNYLIQLIRHTIEFIKGKSYGNKLLKIVKEEVKEVIHYTSDYKAGERRKVIDANQKSIVRHAYFHEYRTLQKLCLLILGNSQHQYGKGTRNVFGALFDGAWLWEEYMNLLIGEYFYHPKNKAGEGAQRLFAGNIGLIYPDFISTDDQECIIADAKYKPIENIGNKDYFQVLAYMMRFDAKRGYYLYPEAGESEDLVLALNQGISYKKNVAPRDEILVVKHGLKIPDQVTDYEDFVEKIMVNEEIFKESLKKKIV